MKRDEGNCNISVSPLSTDLSLTESKHQDNYCVRTISQDLSTKEGKLKNESNEPLWKYRYVIVAIGFFASFQDGYMTLQLSVSLVAMVNHTAMSYQKTVKSDSCASIIRNATEDEISNEMGGEFYWSPKTIGYIQGSAVIGYFCSTIPAGLLVDRYGGKWLVSIPLMIIGIGTLLAPAFSYLSAYALMVLLAITGIAQGFLHPAATVLAANWFPKQERGFLIGLMYSGSSPGSFFGSVLTGYICESVLGWPATFYITGSVIIVFSVYIVYFVVENPKSHPRISKAELDFILNNQENVLSQRRPALPWRKIIKSVPVYALICALFGQIWALTQFWTVHAIFLGTVLHYSIGQNGLLSGAPFLLTFLCTQLASWISLYMQTKKIAGIDFLRKFWNLIACLGISACILGMYFAGCNRTASVVLAILSMGAQGISYAGCVIVIADMSPTFAGSLNSIVFTLAFSANFLLPVVVGYLTDGMQTIEQWNKVFFITIGIVMSSGIVFAIFGSAEVQPWNFVNEAAPESRKKETNISEVDIKEDESNKNEIQTRL